MRLPVRLKPQHPLRKVIAAIFIALVGAGLGLGAHHAPGVRVAMERFDDTLYDAFYALRKPQDRTGRPIVIVTVDEETVQKMARRNYNWPFPRSVWAAAVPYLESCGAKAIVFDITFQDPRAFDLEFGKALDAAKIPVVVGSMFDPDGKPESFAPKVSKPPALGAVNLLDDKVIRDYRPFIYGAPSLAVRAAGATGQALPPWAASPFRLHFYGPYLRKDGRTTYTYLPALKLFQNAMDSSHKQLAQDSKTYSGKLVVFGVTAQALYDLKSAPMGGIYPGVEAQTTAIDNLLSGQHVLETGGALAWIVAWMASLAAALGVILPRRVTIKVMAAALATVALVAWAILWFLGTSIHWLPMASPLLALLLAVVGAFAFSYFAEDRQRRLVLKALGQYISPEVAAEIGRDPESLKLFGRRRDMSVMFTDIQGFTDLSESMESEKLSEMLNFYLGEMSAMVLQRNGTLDKYIGDAIMSFWNAPSLQPNHADLACSAALAMRDREAAIQDQLRELGAPGLLTRIGINTGPMVFGNMGSPQKFNYTVLGDSVNLGSRLEGANKFYGSRILVAETTVLAVREPFVFRELDLLRVKGKQKPLAVFELLGEGPPDAATRDRIDRYQQALKLYRGQQWDNAQEVLGAMHVEYPDDIPAAYLLKRIAKLRIDPPPSGWDGVYVAKDK